MRRILIALCIMLAFTWIGGLTGHIVAVSAAGAGSSGGSTAISITAIPGRISPPRDDDTPRPVRPQPVPVIVNAAGEVIHPALLYTGDALASLFFEQGTLVTDAAGNPIAEIQIGADQAGTFFISMGNLWFEEWVLRQASAPPPDPPPSGGFVGGVYDAGPDGTHFFPPIMLSFAYSEDDFPLYVSEEDLYVAWWNAETQEWIAIADSWQDTENNVILAPVSHFTAFAILAHLQPAKFTYSANMYVEPLQVEVGEPVNIVVSIANIGGLTGSHTVVLYIDGRAEDSREVILTPGESKLVTFTEVRNASGTYNVTVDNLSASFKVEAKPVEIKPQPPLKPEPEQPFPWWIIVLVVLNAILLFVLLRKRETSPHQA